MLRFACTLLKAQGRVASAVLSLHVLSPLAGRFEEDVVRLAPLVPGFLHHLTPACPERLAAEAEAFARSRAGDTAARLVLFWGGTGKSADFLSRSFLRPCVETAWILGAGPSRPSADGACPYCGGLPSLAVRRAQEGSDAGERFLFCPLCANEWPFARIRCPGCLEEDPAKLPTFRAEKHPGVLVEACEGCRRYLKALDLTIDARPVPEVDDLVSVPVDLWAEEQSFERMEPGIAGGFG